MWIVNDDRKVILHYGVKGMKWGVRKDRGTATRAKARNILDQQKYYGNKKDLKDAAWMSQKLSEKAVNAIATASVPVMVNRLLFGNRRTLSQDLTAIAFGAAGRYAKNEISGKGTLKNYQDSGKRDRTRSITGHRLLGTLVGIGISSAPLFASMAKKPLYEAMQKRAENQARVDKWGQNLLPEPGNTAKMHTIWDDGYMSILERIEP